MGTHSNPLVAFFFLRENTIAFVYAGSQAKSFMIAAIFHSAQCWITAIVSSYLKTGPDSASSNDQVLPFAPKTLPQPVGCGADPGGPVFELNLEHFLSSRWCRHAVRRKASIRQMSRPSHSKAQTCTSKLFAEIYHRRSTAEASRLYPDIDHPDGEPHSSRQLGKRVQVPPDQATEYEAK